MNDSKIKDVLSSILEQKWFFNFQIQLIGNKSIISKTNIEKGNNFWGGNQIDIQDNHMLKRSSKITIIKHFINFLNK